MKKILTVFCIFGAVVCSNVSAALIAHYDFQGTANDVTGNGYDGTVSGAQLTTDRFGNADTAYLFDGINDFISIPLLSASLGGSFTISAWIYQTKTISGHPSMGVVHSDRSTFRGVGLSLASNDTARFDIFKTNSSADPNRNEMTGSMVPASTWTMMTLTYEDGSFAKGYINGVLDVSQAATGTAHGNNFHIGHNPYDSSVSRYWGGKIDDVRIYNNALTEAQVQQLFAGTPPTPLDQANIPYVLPFAAFGFGLLILLGRQHRRQRG